MSRHCPKSALSPARVSYDTTETDWSCEISFSPPIRLCHNRKDSDSSNLPRPDSTRHASKKAHSSLRQIHNQSVTSKSSTFSQGNVSSLNHPRAQLSNGKEPEDPYKTPDNAFVPPRAGLNRRRNESVASKSSSVVLHGRELEDPFEIPHNSPELPYPTRHRNESVASHSSSLLPSDREVEDLFSISHNSPKIPLTGPTCDRNESVASKSSSLLLNGREIEHLLTTRPDTPYFPRSRRNRHRNESVAYQSPRLLPSDRDLEDTLTTRHDTPHRNESVASKSSVKPSTIKQNSSLECSQGYVVSYTPPSVLGPNAQKLEDPISKAESAKTIARHRSDSGLGSTDNDSKRIEEIGRSQRKLLAEKTELEGVIQMLQAQIDQMNRAASESNITLDRVTKERNAVVIELSAAYTNIELLKAGNESLEQKNRMLKCSVDALRISTPSEISNPHNKSKVHSKPGPVSIQTSEPSHRKNSNLLNESKVPSKLVPVVKSADQRTHSENSNLHNKPKVHSKPGPVAMNTSDPTYFENSNLHHESKVHSKPGSVARHASQPAPSLKDLNLRQELKVRSKLVPVIEPTTEPALHDNDPTLRPSQSPALALASVIKGLEDEISREKRQFAKHQDLYNNLDPSLGKRARKSLKEKMECLLRTIDSKADYIYSLYDVVEGEMAD